jgi:hypothetical protein
MAHSKERGRDIGSQPGWRGAEARACPHCGSDETTLRGRRDLRFVFRCGNCHGSFFRKRPTANVLVV